jgi:hypothetical protein
MVMDHVILVQPSPAVDTDETTSTDIWNGETVTFSDNTGISVTRSGNTITFDNTGCDLSSCADSDSNIGNEYPTAGTDIDVTSNTIVSVERSLDGMTDIDFGSQTPSTSLIYLYGTSYGIGIDSNTFNNWANTRHRWRLGGSSSGTQYMKLTTTGLRLSPDATDPATYRVGGYYSSTRYGALGSSSYGVHGQYDSTHYGRLGTSTYGVYGTKPTGLGTAGVYGYRSGASSSGYDWNVARIDAGVVGYAYDGRGFTAGVAAYSYLDDANSAALVASNRTGNAPRVNLAYKDAFSASWSVYAWGDAKFNNNVAITGTCSGSSSCDEDIAELISAPKEIALESGDVVTINSDSAELVTKSSRPFDSKVAGIFSTEPGVLLSGNKGGMDVGKAYFGNQSAYDHNGSIPLALAGQVPVKVTAENGPIKKGDLLTTSSKPGYAMKWTALNSARAKDIEEFKQMLVANEKRSNAILGKALEALDSGEGKIIALITLQ